MATENITETIDSPPPTPTDPSSDIASSVRKSDVWTLFERIEIVKDGNKDFKARCGICGKLLSASSNNGTTHLRRHLETHARGQNVDIRSQMLLNANSSGNLVNFSYDETRARQEVVDFIIRAELPFTFVEKHDFKGMIQKGFCPQFKGISASTCKRDVMKLFVQGKDELLRFFEKFDGKICLTSDVWSSRQKMGYMSLTAHFIDKNWNLNKRIICFKMIEYPHTGESLASHISEELISWRIHRKNFSISLDNASNNDVVASLLPDFLMIDSVPRELFHVRCCAHILNLIVQDGLSILSPSIEKITDIVRSMNSSNKRHEIWVHCCEAASLKKKNIDNDVPHRWNSTYELLHVAIKYKDVLHRYVQKVNQSRTCNLPLPTENDWIIAQIVCGFLKIFDSSTKICCGVYYPTSSRVIGCLIGIYATFNAYSRFTVFNRALVSMKTKFNKYWGTFPVIFCFAAIVDPRYKFFAIEEWLRAMGNEQSKIDETILSLKSKLFKLYEHYKKNIVQSDSEVAPNVQVQPPSVSSVPLIPDALSFCNLEDFAESCLKKAKVSSTSSTNSSDLQYYLDVPPIEVDNNNQFSLLGWWRSHEAVYPVLSILARDLLTVPASTVASEAAFSAGGRVVSERRASLSPSTIEALICLKDWRLAESRMQEAAQEEERNEELINARLNKPDWMVDDEAEERCAGDL